MKIIDQASRHVTPVRRVRFQLTPREAIQRRGYCTGPVDGGPAPGEVGLDCKAACCTCGRRVRITVRGRYTHHKPRQAAVTAKHHKPRQAAVTAPSIDELKDQLRQVAEELRRRHGERAAVIIAIGLPNGAHDRFAAYATGPCLMERGLLHWAMPNLVQQMDAHVTEASGGADSKRHVVKDKS